MVISVALPWWRGTGGWLGLVLLWSASVLAGTAHAQPQSSAPLVLGTSRPDGSYAGRLLRRTYQELFRRMGSTVEVRQIPSARLAMELGSDRIDGDLGRPLAFGEGQPGLVRVEEPIMQISFALWSLQSRPALQRVEQLAESGLTVNFTRGVVECERMLQPWLPAQRLTDVTTTINALNLLQLGRNDLHCGIDMAVLSDASSPELPGLPPLTKVLTLGEPIPLYFYLQRKHAALVPQIDATLKRMKAEGVLEQIRRDTLAEYKLFPAQKLQPLPPTAPAR